MAGKPDPRTWMLQQSQTSPMQNTARDRFLLLEHIQQEAAAPKKWTFNSIHIPGEGISAEYKSGPAVCSQCCRATVWSVQASPRLLPLSLMSQSHRKRGFHWWNQVNGYSQTSAIIMTGHEMHQWKVTLQSGHCLPHWEVGISLPTCP